MAKIYRPFYVEFWDDDKLPFKSNDFRLVFLHVVWNRFTTPLGIYHADLEALHANFNKNKEMPFERYVQLFLEGAGESFREAYPKPLAKVRGKVTPNLSDRFWQHSQKVGVTFIENWWKVGHPRNRPGNPNILASWLPMLDDIPDCELKTVAIHRVLTFAEGWGEPFGKVCRNLSARLGVSFRQPYPQPSPNREREQRKGTEKKDKNIPAQETEAGGGNVEKSVEKKTKSRHFELMDLAIKTFQSKYPKSKITPGQVSILAYGRGGGRKGPCFGELDVVVELFKKMPIDLQDPVGFAMRMATEPEWISDCTKAVEAKERTGPQINRTEPVRMDFASVMPTKPVEVE